jgi:hypothetical protein
MKIKYPLIAAKDRISLNRTQLRFQMIRNKHKNRTQKQLIHGFFFLKRNKNPNQNKKK